VSFEYSERPSLFETLRMQWRVILALMLRDVRTRFFGTAYGFIVAMGWPLANIFILVAIYTFAGRTAPYGSSSVLWFTTGLVPFMAFQYMSRYTMLGIAMNSPMLGLPVVKVMDLMLARGLLELLNAGVVTLVSILILAGMGVPFMPVHPVQAAYAMGACMFLGFGMINGILAGLFPFWVTGYALFSIVLWITSGVLIIPDDLPETARYWLSWIPSLQGVEWMRSAYYEGFGEGVLDRTYMLSFAAVALCLGLALERVVRRKMLE
jgi:capsular polysaccharide transport system permease protein